MPFTLSNRVYWQPLPLEFFPLEGGEEFYDVGKSLSAADWVDSVQSPPQPVTGTSDLRPGMVLPDGAVVVSVGPLK